MRRLVHAMAPPRAWLLGTALLAWMVAAASIGEAL